MADLALRFGKDMLVVSSPIQEALRRAGIESVCDQALALLVEPETIEEAYRMETVAGPQCMVTPVADFTPARLVAVGAEGKGEALAEAALAVMAEFKPQHTLVEIASCGLPLDPDSKASLVENRDQYARAAQFFDGRTFDAFFLNGFTTADDLKCALMGLRKVTDAPIIASVDVQGDGGLASGRGTWREAVEVMVPSPEMLISPADSMASLVASTVRLSSAPPVMLSSAFSFAPLTTEMPSPSLFVTVLLPS
jgi:5-methyltetrahydrofolate--homocysteine methyltransferase